jgi:YfiH family protein
MSLIKYSILSDLNKIAYLEGVDALITNLSQVCIGVTTADCVPVLLFDKVNNVIAAVHAGWRGTCSRIVEKTIQLMITIFGTEPNNVFASIGVSISPEVYNVGHELIEEFEKAKFPVKEIFNSSENQLFLDLWKANKWLLMQTGVPENQIEIAGICSFTNSNDYFSARKLCIKSGRMLSGIMLK